MLKITKAEEQAVRLVMQLAVTNRQMTLAELAARERLPEPTVAKLLSLLRRGGVVQAARGRNGGYAMAASPGEISTAVILRAVGAEPVQTHSCLEDPEAENCPRVDDCGLRSVWRLLGRRVAEVLEQTSVADLLNVEARVNGHVRQIWPAEMPLPRRRDYLETSERSS